MDFSVLVPTYNQVQYLGAALDSLLGQSYSDWEAIIIDDGSTDGTAEVIQSYCQHDHRFRAVHKDNGGVASALNMGLDQARGDWICWLSSDDLFDSQKLAIHKEWILKHPGCQFFFTHFRELDHATREIKEPPLWRDIPDQDLQVLETLVTPFIHGNSICINRAAWQRVGKFTEELRYGQDYDMWLRLLAFYPATFIPERTCITRLHPAQTTHTFPQSRFYDSARAAIDFLNQHTFSELFPLVDLHDLQIARTLAKKALNIATSPGGFLHMLGPNPALLFRILEWAWHYLPLEIADPVKQMFIDHVTKISFEYHGTTIGFYCKVIAVACRFSGGRFDYPSISPISVAELNYWQLSASGSPDAQLVRRYLNERFKDQDLREAIPVSNHPGKEMVFVCQRGTRLGDLVKYGTFRATIEQARYCMRAGYLVLLTGLSERKVDFIEGVIAVGTLDNQTMAQLIGMLTPVDTLIGVSRADILQMTCARRTIIYHHGPHPIERTDLLQSTSNKSAVPVVCVSNYSRKEQISYGVAESQTQLVQNAYDSRIFDFVAYEQNRPLHSLVYAGHIVPYKGVDIAIRAFIIIKQRFQDASLNIYGANLSWKKSADHLLTSSWMDVNGFPNWLVIERDVPGLQYGGELLPSKLADAFRRCSLLIMPSRVAETFGIVSLEAQACGCIPILPRHGGFPETLQEGQTGYLYDDNTPDNLAAKIMELWDNNLPTPEQRLQAHKWVQDTFSWDRSGQVFLAIVEATPPRICRGFSVALYYLSLQWRQAIFFGHRVRKGIIIVFHLLRNKPIYQWSDLLRSLWRKYR